MSTLQERWAEEDKGFVVLTPCATCRHRITGLTCAAFPNGIPQIVLTGTEQHRTPLPGDNGIQYEQEAR